MSAAEVTKIRNRLRLRLGANSLSKLVSGKSLLDAVVSLGLTMYHEDEWRVRGFLHGSCVLIGSDSCKSTCWSFWDILRP